MSMSILDRLSIGKQLGGLMQEQKKADALRRMTIGKEIVEVMLRLGLGAAASASPEPEPLPAQPTEETPQIVTDFLAGAFAKVPQMEFVDILRAIAGYVGSFLTLEQAKKQTENWVSQNGYTFARKASPNRAGI